MAAEYPGIVIPADEDVDMDIIFYNKGRQDENVNVWIDQPAVLKSSHWGLTKITY
jgi:hypothetical protein